MLVVGIIFLFLGLAVEPITSMNISQTEEITVTNTIEEDDCEECESQELSKSELEKLERIIDRLKIYSKMLLPLSTYNPEIVVICEEILEFLNNGIIDIICEIILNPLWHLWQVFWELYHNAESDFWWVIGVFGVAFVGAILEGIHITFCPNWESPDWQLLV